MIIIIIIKQMILWWAGVNGHKLSHPKYTFINITFHCYLLSWVYNVSDRPTNSDQWHLSNKFVDWFLLCRRMRRRRRRRKNSENLHFRYQYQMVQLQVPNESTCCWQFGSEFDFIQLFTKFQPWSWQVNKINATGDIARK